MHLCVCAACRATASLRVTVTAAGLCASTVWGLARRRSCGKVGPCRLPHANILRARCAWLRLPGWRWPLRLRTTGRPTRTRNCRRRLRRKCCGPVASNVIGERSHGKRARFRVFRRSPSVFGAGAGWVSLEQFHATRFINLGNHPERSGGLHVGIAALACFACPFLQSGRRRQRRSSSRFTFLGGERGHSEDWRSGLVALRSNPNSAAHTRAPWRQLARQRIAVAGAGLGGFR
jgi:hypothetical protein